MTRAENKEKYKQYDQTYYMKHRRPKTKIGQAEQRIADLEAKLAESEKKHLLDEKEWQDYCAYKYIEPQIKGCLEREKEYQKQLAEKEKEIQMLNAMIATLPEHDKELKEIYNQDKISFALEQLEKTKEFLYRHDLIKDYQSCAGKCFFEQYIDNQIKQLKEGK